MPQPPQPIPSPCIKDCTLDAAHGLCRGCYRTVAEITAWPFLLPTERQALLQELPARRASQPPAQPNLCRRK